MWNAGIDTKQPLQNDKRWNKKHTPKRQQGKYAEITLEKKKEEKEKKNIHTKPNKATLYGVHCMFSVCLFIIFLLLLAALVGRLACCVLLLWSRHIRLWGSEIEPDKRRTGCLHIYILNQRNAIAADSRLFIFYVDHVCTRQSCMSVCPSGEHTPK